MAAWPIIQDPWFWAVAVPAVLLMGMAKSGFLMGFGALATPLMALAVPVPQAVAIMLPLLLVMDATGIRALWKERDRELLRLILPAGLLGIGVGTLLFGVVSVKTTSAVLGAITLLYLLHRAFYQPPVDAKPLGRAAGFGLAMTAGFTSFVAHAGSPPISAYLLPMKLPPIRFVATMAVFFGAVNLAKWLPYAWLGLLDTTNLATSAVLLPLGPLSVWLGIWATKRIASRAFYAVAYVGMSATGLKLLWDGLR
jgi:uncharacterized protein